MFACVFVPCFYKKYMFFCTDSDTARWLPVLHAFFIEFVAGIQMSLLNQVLCQIWWMFTSSVRETRVIFIYLLHTVAKLQQLFIKPFFAVSPFCIWFSTATHDTSLHG